MLDWEPSDLSSGPDSRRGTEPPVPTLDRDETHHLVDNPAVAAGDQHGPARAHPRATTRTGRGCCLRPRRERSSCNGWEPGPDVLPAVRVAVRGARRSHGRDVRGAAPRPVPPDRPGDLCEGQGCAGDRLPPVAAAPPLRRTRPKDAADPGWEPITWDEALDTVAARLLAVAASDGPESVGLRLELAVDVGDQRRGRLGPAADPCLRQPELLQLHGAVRVGPVPRAALHVRRLRARRLSAGSRERRLHPVLGVQPVRGPARARDEHRGGGGTRREAGRRRPAQGGPGRQGRPLAAGDGPAPTRRSRCRSRT